MKKIILLGLLVLWATTAHAEPSIPRTLNLQSIIYDLNGNITAADTIDLTVRVVDGNGAVLFTEDILGVTVIRGAINVEIGAVSGGLPLSVFDPTTGEKFIDILVDGSDPFEFLPLSSVPYAFFAEKALSVADDVIESRHIKDGTIELVDIAPGIAFSDLEGQASEDQIPGVFVKNPELQSHLTASPAHAARDISIGGIFYNFVADDVHEAIQKLDSRLAEEIFNRQANTGDLDDTVTTATGSLQGEIAANDSDIGSLQGQVTANDADITGLQGTDTSLQGQITANDSDIAALQSTASDINNVPGTLTESKIDATITRDAEYQAGDTALQAQITVNDTDISNLQTSTTGLQTQITANDTEITTLQGTVSNINNLPGTLGESRIDALIARDSEYQAGDTALQAQITVNDTDITALQGTVSNINNLPGTLGEGKIDAAIARDSELSFANLSGSITDAQIPASITRDTELSFGNLSGSIADGQVPASFTRDTELAFANLAGTISDGQIPASITRDSELATHTGSTSNPHSVTAAQVGAAETAHNHDTSYSALAHDHDGDYVNQGGDTMSGDLDTDDATCQANLGRDCFIDGVDLTNHETRITALEGVAPDLNNATGQVDTGNVPQFMRPAAFGTLFGTAISNDYNVDSATNVNGVCSGGGSRVRIDFSSSLSSANYVVIVTQPANPGLSNYVVSKDSANFVLCTPGGGDFVAFHP